MDQVDSVVVGAGVVGLAVARELARAGREVVVVEATEAVGTVTSARNSEVLHAGIYYPPGSLKARLCVAGRERLYAYCAERRVPHRRCGKLIVATGVDQLGELARLEAQARASGVDDLVLLDVPAIAALEPALSCVAALHSPSTGIIDSHQYMLALEGDARDAGAVFAFGSPLVGGDVTGDGIGLVIGGAEPMTLCARSVVNCAGHDAPRVARSIAGLPGISVPRAYLCKGNYFRLAGRSPFSRLVYPIPEAAGLGVHLTLDLGDQARFGPDVEWVDAVDYAVDPARAGRFYPAIRRYWPALPDGALVPDYAGVRPKIQAPGEPARDFVIEGPHEHGVAGLVNLFGIESPGLTASLAIAEYAVGKLRETG
ncbi:MAG TPA: NAD(P)/FAD-dependent oxidoreductase [Casimicrobiaceae bacterium]|nr:NAD(P)/FAD-dependent oxidoreductase [Casimicrobiaceae bacterium]